MCASGVAEQALRRAIAVKQVEARELAPNELLMMQVALLELLVMDVSDLQLELPSEISDVFPRRDGPVPSVFSKSEFAVMEFEKDWVFCRRAPLSSTFHASIGIHAAHWIVSLHPAGEVVHLNRLPEGAVGAA